MSYLLKPLSRNGRTEYVDIKIPGAFGVRIRTYCAHVPSCWYGQTVCPYFDEDMDKPFVHNMMRIWTNRLTIL